MCLTPKQMRVLLVIAALALVGFLVPPALGDIACDICKGALTLVDDIITGNVTADDGLVSAL
jgi:hypothetical protein